MKQTVRFVVHEGHENNASPNVSSAGGGSYNTLDEAVASLQEWMKALKIPRRPDLENDRWVFVAERIEPWPKESAPRPHFKCPRCGYPDGPRPRLIPRGVVPPRRDRPYAHRYYARVSKEMGYDY